MFCLVWNNNKWLRLFCKSEPSTNHNFEELYCYPHTFLVHTNKNREHIFDRFNIIIFVYVVWKLITCCWDLLFIIHIYIQNVIKQIFHTFQVGKLIRFRWYSMKQNAAKIGNLVISNYTVGITKYSDGEHIANVNREQ